MLKIRSALMTAILTVAPLTFPVISLAQFGEHPAEHPAGEQSEVTTETIADAIDAHVRKERGENDGYFLVDDKENQKTLYLILDKIHRDRLSAVEKDLYFACVDFAGNDGRTYDIDFFLKYTGGELVVTETNVHKVDGKPHYNWGKKGDFWVKVPAD